jgi:von Willebrand factor type A domain
VTIWSSSQFTHRNRAIVGAVLVAVAALVSAGWQPAFASPEDPRVIAIHTASAPRVSVVVELPRGPSGTTRQLDDVSVWIRDTQVPTTVTPMASDALSVALVIDTASETSVDTLQRAQSGATEFLLRLPPQAHRMVITAGGDPRIVAPLTPHPAQALSAVSELRPGGQRSTVAAVMVAAQKLADAPAGPLAIVVYANGADADPTQVEPLIEAITQAEAVVSVIQHGQDGFWPPVLARTGGAVMPAGVAEIVQSYRQAATALSHQYLVTFDTPGALPVQARLVLSSDGVSATTTVELPRSDPRTPLTETTPSDRTPGPISAVAVLVLLSVLGLLVLLRRGRDKPRTQRVPVTRVSSIAGSGSPAPAGAETHRPETRRADNASAQRPTSVTTTSPVQPPRRASLSDAIHGVRAGQQAAASGSQRTPRPRPTEASQPQLRPPHRQQPPTTHTRSDLPPGIRELFTKAGSETAQPHRHLPPMVIAGSGDAVVDLATKTPAASVLRIVGNSASRYFGVQTVETVQSLVNTTDPYDGVRLLERDSAQSVALRVRATGPWLIEALTIAEIPSFDTSYTGDGDAVVRYTGNGSTATIVGNAAGRYFGVRSISTHGNIRLVNTTHPYSKTSSISTGPQFFEIQAVGSWTITIT